MCGLWGRCSGVRESGPDEVLGREGGECGQKNEQGHAYAQHEGLNHELVRGRITHSGFGPGRKPERTPMPQISTDNRESTTKQIVEKHNWSFLLGWQVTTACHSAGKIVWGKHPIDKVTKVM